MKYDLNNWLDFEQNPPPKDINSTFVAWDVSLGSLTLVYWNGWHEDYLDIEFGEPVTPTFWLPLFPPDHERYGHKYVGPARTLSTEEVLALYGYEPQKGTILPFNARKAVN